MVSGREVRVRVRDTCSSWVSTCEYRCVHVQVCSGSMHACGLDPLRENHGDTRLITPGGKAALRKLGNQWPDVEGPPWTWLGALDRL